MKQTRFVGTSLFSLALAAGSASVLAGPQGGENAGTTPDAAATGPQAGTAQDSTSAPSAQAPTTASTDSVITSAVNAELAKDPQLQAAQIQVDTQQGRVALKGTAPSEQMRDRAEQIATAVQGVTGVDNQLTVQGRS